jgi:anti-sigma-K factor RskA
VNIKEYISSGIVESYVLGLATEQERIEFEQLCLRNPELVAARNEFEEKLEKQAFEKAITAPGFLKEKILTTIREEQSFVKEAKIIAMEKNPTQKSSWSRYVAAAAVILLLVSAYFAYDFYLKNEELKGSYSRLKSQVDSINNELVQQKKSMMDPDAAVVVSMVGTQPTPSTANVYWDTASKSVFLVVKNLPKLPNEKQYQLWAFIDGKPLDLGLFDATDDKVILKMKNTQKADAFAITIENKGNGPVPQGPVETIGKTKL